MLYNCTWVVDKYSVHVSYSGTKQNSEKQTVKITLFFITNIYFYHII